MCIVRGKNMMTDKDIKQLRILSVMHYVLATPLIVGFTPLSILGFYLIRHFITNVGNSDYVANPSEALTNWGDVITLSSLLILSWVWVVCLILAGIKIWKKKSRTFCQIIAGITCISFPVGTALGVFSLITLSKESVKKQFCEAVN